MVPLSYHNCIFLFQSFLIITCKKNNYEVSNNILYCYWTKAISQDGHLYWFYWQLYFFDSYIYFFHIIGKISRFRQSHPCQILRISSCYFPLSNLCKIIAHTKSSSYDQNTRKRLQGVQNINTHKLLVK